MTESRQQNAPLYVGAVIAVFLHLMIGGPILSASWGVHGTSPLNSALDGKSESERRQRERMEDALRKAKELALKDDEVVPGLEDGADEGMTWIGYAEYQEHLAQHSEVDQAAFTETDAGGGGALAQGDFKPLPAVPPGEKAQAPVPPEQAVPPSPAPTPPAVALAEAVRTASPTETPLPSDERGLAPAPVKIASAESELPTAPAGPDALLPPAIDRPEVKPDPAKDPPPTAEVKPDPRPEPPPTDPTSPTDPTPQSKVSPSPDPVPPSPPAQSPQNAVPPSPNSGAGGATSPVVSPVTGPPGSVGASKASGEKSDRESDATSIADVPPSLWRNGKPLARKGLEIKTKKPELPILTKITTSPSNPICEILFGRDGVPVTCTVLQSSGYPDIDGPVTDALYRWRAKGSQLEQLAPGKTLKFRIRFILN